MKQYPTNLTDSQWSLIEGVFNNKRPRKHKLRDILNAIFYLLKTGCQWRMLPFNFPPWQTVYYYLTVWRHNETIDRIHELLRDKVRQKAGREKSPSLGLIDSQSVKTTRSGGICRGIDGGKKTKRRKRHIIVDTLGLLLAVAVHAAKEHDSKSAPKVLALLKNRFDRLVKIIADGGYPGELIEYTKSNFKLILEIVLRKDDSPKFQVIPQRWVVERTFSWFESNRRLSKDFEFRTDTSETMIRLAMIKLVLNRL
ncbi:IS5 family transposase [Parabacteroides sp. FAFU027]|uniref:IS5 family transposase n=1 Tax=Parabacteroides sp. FAFU027 TaxID=2922715 RepID=UPI001FAF87AA|nr:IS5 family transposase [Parabacteroides sp. FAFU027]